MGKANKRYRWALAADKPKWRKDSGATEVLKDIHEPLRRAEGPYRIKLRGKHEQFSIERSLPGTLDRLEDRLRSGDIGDFFMVEPDHGRRVLVRIVRQEDRDVDAPGGLTPSAGRIYSDIWGHFRTGIQYWGGFNCRNIAGTSTWSQHAWGNAIDVHPATMSIGDEVARFGRNNTEASQVLWRVTNHYDHIHLSGRPLESGRPPCA